jgi:hypothetical protein
MPFHWNSMELDGTCWPAVTSRLRHRTEELRIDPIPPG